MIIQKTLKFETPGRGMINITAAVTDIIETAKINTGICNLFLHHTSASLILCENSDPDVQRDLEVFIGRLIPDGDSLFNHVAEGPDDMPAHIRTILTQNALSIPITKKHLALGTWQGIFLWEHRLQAHHRHLTVTLMGE